MITKERLEELIKQGATIYSTCWKEEIDLSQKCEVINKTFYDGKTRLVLIVYEDEEHSPQYLVSNLTEDIEGAEWNKELKQLQDQLSQAQKTIEILKMSNDALREDNLDLSYDKVDSAYEYAKEMAINWESGYQEEIKELRNQLALTEKALELACYKLTDFEHTEKESMHSSQYWYDYLQERAEEMMKSE